MGSRNWKQVFATVRNMDRQELLFRSRQEVSKRADALLARAGYDFAKHSQSSAAPRRGRFFFPPDQIENLLALIRERLPQTAGQIVERAEKICSHRFSLLGYDDLVYGREINWHLDAAHQKVAPRKPFYKIKYLNYSEVGDSKVTWELNRHQHFVALAKAYRLSGDERFARELLSQWESWHSQNPYPMGINWASSLEVAWRSLSWIWTHALLEGTKFLSDEFEAAYLSAQAINARHIEKHLSTYFSPNTHLLGEGVALFFLGTICSELRGAARWKSLGWRIVLEEAEKQINPDGMHFEQSVYYHVYALDFFVHAALLASANGIELGAKFEQTLERMMNALFLLARAGTPPRFGDDDGGRLFDPARNRDEHLIDPLATGAILFHRGEYKAICRDLREETVWLLGEQGVAEWDRLDTKTATLNSTALKSSGIYVLSAPSAQSQLIVKSGPSVPQVGGHAHADAMSVCLQSFGQPSLIDPGAYEYVGEGGRRNLYRGTAMHNTVVIDGLDQSEPDGPFSWKQDIAAKTERWITGETFDLFVGVHHGYSRLPEPVLHKRFAVAMKSGAFLVRDLLEGSGRHRCEICWRLSPDLQLHAKDVFRSKNSAHRLALLTVEKHGWSEEVCKGPWSPVYGVERATMVSKFGTTKALPAEFVTLIVPLAEADDSPGKLFRIFPDNTGVSAYRYETSEGEQQLFFRTSMSRWGCGRVASDAEFLSLVIRNNEVAQIILCGGTFVEVGGKQLVSATRMVDRCEIIQGEIFCSDRQAITKSPLATRLR